MSEVADAGLRQQAIDWRISLRDAPAAQWEAFTEWLEQSELHACAYDAVALADDMLGSLHAAPDATVTIAPGDDGMMTAPRAPARRRWLAPLAAIAAVLIVALFALSPFGPGSSIIETAPGETRSVELADGSTIDLNGATRLKLTGARQASLETGEAAFHIVHDAANPFTLALGDSQLRDLGTTFDVVREHGRLEIAVAEGAVLYDPDAEAIRLTKGQRLRLAANSDTAAVGAVDPGAVGAWRKGRLVYDGTPLATVAADIQRRLGTPVSADPAVAERPFTGVVTIDRDRQVFFHKLGGLLGVDVAREGDGWRLGAGSRAAR